MKYPCLVPKRLCKTDIHVHLESEDTDNHGQPEKALDLELKCNFQDRAKTILTTISIHTTTQVVTGAKEI